MKEVMILAFDIGNTNISFCKFKKRDTGPADLRKIAYQKLKNNILDSFLYKEISDYILQDDIEAIIYSSVNKNIDNYIERLANDLNIKKIFAVSPSLKIPVKILYDDPFTLGADRICNAAAVSNLYPGENVIIIDMGTAITFCVLLEGKIFKGGLIFPGVDIALDALFEKTNLLERVDFKKPDKLIATNSEDAIRSGIYYGWNSMLESIIKKIENEEKIKFKKVITGGFSENLITIIPDNYIIDKFLTMKGLKVIYDLNC